MSTQTPITLLSRATAIVLDKAGLEADRTADVELTLDITAGASSINGVATPCYRPWYAAAKLLEQNLDVQALSQADGAKFTGQAVVIRSLYGIQQAIDVIDAADQPLVLVDPALAAIVGLSKFNDNCGCGAGKSNVVMSAMVGAWR
jgi:hypothetical protein